LKSKQKKRSVRSHPAKKRVDPHLRNEILTLIFNKKPKNKTKKREENPKKKKKKKRKQKYKTKKNKKTKES
jgi:hypothetical protein